MIEARRVTYRVGASTLLDDVSLSVDPGEVVVVVGPNGAGKSTLLRVLAGDVTPTSGRVLMADRSLSEWSIRDRARMRAVLPQSSDLTFPFSAYEVVLLGRSPHLDGRETEQDRAISRLAMKLTDTLDFEERSYPTLSGGERQRVQAARVVAQIWETHAKTTRPRERGPMARALVLDEPTANLDLAHQHAMLLVARRMAEERCAVLCVLHDLNLAAQYASRIAVLDRGRLRAVDRPSRVLTPELLAEVFRVDALVVPHPELSCPLVVSRGPVARQPEAPP